MGRCSISVCVCLLSIGLSSFASEPFANTRFVSPEDKEAPVKAVAPLSASVIAGYLARVNACHVFDQFTGKNAALRAAALADRSGALHGGEVVDTTVGPETLFGAAQQDGSGWVFLASIVSVDAEAMRLRVDLSALDTDSEVFVIAPGSGRAFGPYTSADDRSGERWLASVRGDEAVLLVRSPRPDVPQLSLTAYSHIFLSMRDLAKEMSCHLDIACENDEAVLQVSSGTAIILVGGDWFCSGQLVNNELTESLEPFFVTANHCICSQKEAEDTEVYWDFRSPECNSTEIPDMDDLPRNNGQALLATRSDLDATLIRLDGVEVGEHGRSYLGWDAREPEVDDAVYAIHYPDATYCRISKGTIRATNQSANKRTGQIETHWDYGVTEAGSSGSCLMYTDTNRLAGMLSQGPTHSCETTIGNLDWFASFHRFYPYVEKYIDTATPSTQTGEDDCGESDTSLCPFVVAYENAPRVLERFRLLRDSLTKTASGRWAVREYKTVAPTLARTVRQSDVARSLFVAVTAPLAGISDAVGSLSSR